ncbi:hypothetical protein LV457_19940 [Mycobacterium sp. MYCO198283]|uniref:hypothetical protein n=1 Tax=Mycobacterium sp. MYCO198283 TaxID=2883505 RepID=UPI001E60BDA6|nr:hypothetical protein [Mycobacterium sp. MYCO198283]MCG5434546.1 hypothetical protein [Mycobacterium sp. MYCO198283]
MSDGRDRWKAKQARRNARRMERRGRSVPDEAPLASETRQALASGHPLHLLGMASMLVHLTEPDRLRFLKPGKPEPLCPDGVVTSLIDVPGAETTALLAVLAELLALRNSECIDQCV